MALSRKTYVAIAQIINSNQKCSAETIADRLADHFASDNPAFDHDKFMKACGFDPSLDYDFKVTVYDFSHDVHGNPTAHWRAVDKDGMLVGQSGSRRKQCGYGDGYADPAKVQLNARNVVKVDGERSDGHLTTYLKS